MTLRKSEQRLRDLGLFVPKRHPWCKLKPEDVRLVRALREGPKPLSFEKIAEKFEISAITAHRAAVGKHYRWVR